MRLCVQGGEEGLADLEFRNHSSSVEVWIWPERLRRGSNSFFILGGKCSEGMLHPVAQLSKNCLGNVQRVLRNEIDADAFGPDESDNLLDPFQQGFWRFAE